jgi:L-fuconate dehydratase
VTQHRPEDAAMVPAQPAVVPAGGPRIVALDCFDVRFPTSLAGDGSDAMNPDPDYSAAYAVLRTDVGGPEGHALCFTIGRGRSSSSCPTRP